MLKNKNYHKFLPALAAVASGLCLMLPAVKAAVPSLPTLKWQQRSDWINVKTDVTPAAVGDGIHDDTAAIQTGLNRLSRGYYGSKSLYLPAGTYRISKTLSLDNIYGALIVGQGQTTRVVWHGPLNQAMYVSNGACRSRYVGIVWDGANIASVGIDHRPHLYETLVRHQDEAFLNFRQDGVRVGYQEVAVTSEVSYRNCLFQNCGAGVATLSYNDVNNNFAGCEFQDNGVSIDCERGNAYVRDCHFERSRTTDIFLPSAAHSVRRCTSVGSKQFITVPYSGGGCALTAEDCHVDGWTGTQGAMSFGMFGPTTVVDCSFTNPPDTKAPIRLTNAGNCQQPLIVSNNSAPSSEALIDQGADSRLSYLPAGVRGPNLSDPNHSFLKSVEAVPATILDVKTRFGAKGNDSADDTIAITNALNAAKSQGGNAVVYFPEGMYRVSSTLPIGGGNYTVEGTGCQSMIRWVGNPGGVVFSVMDPQGIALKNLLINAPATTACIQQTSNVAAPSRMTYEEISVGGGRGLECVGLSASSVVHLDTIDGSTHFTDCSRAVILGDFMTGGVLQVDGAQYAKTGFLGVQAHNDCSNVFDVIIRDNQDFVGTNFYTEQTQAALSVSGDGALLGQPGHVTIEGNKTMTSNTSLAVNDYEGRVTYAGAGMFSYPSLPPVAHSGVRPVDIVLLGDSFTGVLPHSNFGPGAKLTCVGNYVLGGWGIGDASLGILQLPSYYSGVSVPDTTSLGSGAFTARSSPSATLATPAVAALDDFRLLGAYDLAINFP